MYTIAIELHGLQQLTRISPGMVTETRRQAITMIEVQGGTYVGEESGLWVFRFERSRPEDRNGILDALEQSTGLLRGKEHELSGWTLFLDFIEDGSRVGRQIRDRLLAISEENEVWVGEAAASLLHAQLALQDVGYHGLRRVSRDARATDPNVGSVQRLARSEAAVELLIDAISQHSALRLEESEFEMILAVGDDPSSLRVNAREALARMQGSAAVPWLEAEPQGNPLWTLFDSLSVHETPFWLRSHEKSIWAERSGIVQARLNRDFGSVLPDALELDLVMALELYLVAYARRALAAAVTPVVLCHQLDRWDPAVVDTLLRTARRTGSEAGLSGIAILGTATQSARARQLGREAGEVVKLPRRSIVELSVDTGVRANWDRVARWTGGRPTAVAHYLAAVEYWDTRPDDQSAVSEEDLAWRVVQNQDSDVQEVLLAMHYLSPLLTDTEFATGAERLGTDGVRVPAILELLVTLGLVEEATPRRPAIDLRKRLEFSLGSKSKTVLQRSAAFVLDLVAHGSLESSSAVVRLVVEAGLDTDLPRIYHEFVRRELSCRKVESAHSILYDAIPPRGFQPVTKTCMQTVVSASRLRLALLEGNMQAAERIHLISDTDASECDFAEADLAIQRARYSFLAGPGKDTVALLKRAIVIYQELEDQSGLARANLDFGLVMLANEDILGAREYFLLAAKAAAEGDDLLEQLRAQQLMVINEFVYGNLTRANDGAERLYGHATAAGMRDLSLFSDLTRGRVLFELGRYDEAVEAFAEGRSRTRLYGSHEPGLVMERWIARSLLYSGKQRRALEILQTIPVSAESCFFVAEAELRRGDHGLALDALERGLQMDTLKREPVERVGWTTGYASLEDRAIGVTRGTPVLTHQMLALRGYLLAESGQVAEGVNEMHRLTRELRTSEIDPYNRIYFYLYSLILPDSGELNLEDGSTVLGKAVRYIQQRTSRMDEYAHKTDYLRRNYWNARLMSHAQSHNLA